MELRTIMTFTNPADMLVIRSLLESEGIMCYTKDELTAQVNPFYSNAIGGVKLQVQDSDAEEAIALLQEAGYLKEEVLPPTPQWIITLDSQTAKIPLLKNIRLSYRILAILGIVLFTIVSLVYFISRSTTSEFLTENKWCLNTVVYQERGFHPETIRGKYPHVFFGCDTEAQFNADGSLVLPGFSSPEINARWEIVEDKLIISAADTFAFVYNGTYEIITTDDILNLRADSTKLFLSKYGKRGPTK